jgi:hypothetical protein
MPTPTPPSAETIPDPYVGLRPYTDSDDDRARFFGRERDQEIIIANLYSAPLTIFYGASGVGKSSVLLAGVVPELRQTPRFACAVFRTWQAENVLPLLKAAILTAVQKAAKQVVEVDLAMALDDFLLECTRVLRGHIVLIFDQFEEYFLYHAASAVSEGFDAEFARSVNRSEIDASFLLSMREDSLSKLDRFQGRIPNLLNNLLRLDHLDRDATMRAIREPLAAYNKRLQPGEPPASIDDELVDALLDQVKTGSIILDQAREAGAASVGAGPINDGTWIETAFLQVVLVRLWDEEAKHGSRRLRLGTLKKLGGAAKIMRSHLDKAMGKLRWRYRRIAADIFGYLVTPSGGKIAQTVADLASYCRRRQSRVASLLERLADSNVRVLRAISSPPGEPGGVRYEIFHDVLAPAVLAWRSRKLVWRRVRRGIAWTVGVPLVGILIPVLLVGLFYVFKAREIHEAQQTGLRLIEMSQKFREKAKADLADKTDPNRNISALRNLSLALALNCNFQDTEAAKLARDLLLQHVWCPPAAAEVRYREDALLAATFAPGGSNNEIFAVAGDGQLLHWKGRELSPVRSLFEKPKPANLQEIVQPGFASFSPDGQWLLIIPPTLASAANAEAAAQGAVQQGAPPTHGSSDHEPCKVQNWRWGAQNRIYESAGADLEIQRLPDSRTNFVWSGDSDRVVLINLRMNDAECHVFEVGENRVKELPDRSAQLTGMKIVALAFSLDRKRIAAVSSERKVTLIGRHDLQVIPKALNGNDWIQLPEGFQPNSVAFGPGDDELTLMSWSDLRILNALDGRVVPIPPPTFRDQSMRMVVGPGDSATRLVATSLYGRVEVAKSARRQEPAEPVVFRGSIGIPQFSSDGQRVLILSGGMVDAFDSMRLIDVSPLYRPQEAAPEKFEEKAAPPWLVDIATAASALDASGDGSLITLEDVRERYRESKAGHAYESVWKRFFPEEKSNARSETGR